MNAIEFNKDGKTVWTSSKGTVSKAIQAIDETFNMETGFITEEKFIYWVKGNSEEAIDKQLPTIIKAINNGKLRLYRALSHTPFVEGQDSDINPSTGKVLNRYSQTRMCPADKFESLHRQFVVPTIAAVSAESIAVEA